MMNRLPHADTANDGLLLETISGVEISKDKLHAVFELCQRAYGEDLEFLYGNFPDPTHILAYHQKQVVSHALWITRWLQFGNEPLLRTAYVEFVATDPPFQRRGYGKAVMRHLAHAVRDFDLAALCTGVAAFYQNSGWISWRGPLYIRSEKGLIETPNEEVMILRLPNTPTLDLTAPLSAEWREGELW